MVGLSTLWSCAVSLASNPQPGDPSVQATLHGPAEERPVPTSSALPGDAYLQSPFGFVLYGTDKSDSGENGEPTGLQDAKGEPRGPGPCILFENTFRK